jgi:hypothetical protein
MLLYAGPCNTAESREKINIAWAKTQKVYRPVVVYEVTLKDDLNNKVSIGNVHTSPGEGDNEWQRQPEWEQLEAAFRDAGRTGYWLMGGDYYLGAESRVRRGGTGHVADLDPETAKKIFAYYEEVKKTKAPPRLTLAGARKTIGSATQQDRSNMDALLDELGDGPHDGTEALLDDPEFCDDFEAEIKNTKRLDANQSGKDALRNVEGLTFAKNLPGHWWIAQTISGTNTYLDSHSFPDYADIEVRDEQLRRARDFTRARYTSKMRIADFFIYNQAWRSNPDAPTLACKLGMLDRQAGLHWYDESDLRHSRYWRSISDHFPVGGLFTTDPADPLLSKLSAGPSPPPEDRPVPSAVQAPDARDCVILIPQDGDCFFHALRRAGVTTDPVVTMRDHAALAMSKYPGVYVGWNDWKTIAEHYGVTLVVHEYHYGEPDKFVKTLPEINPGQEGTVHLRFIHMPDDDAGHIDLLQRM